MIYRLKRFLALSNIEKLDNRSLKILLGYSKVDGKEIEGDESVLYLLSLLDGKNSIDDIKDKIIDKFPYVTKEDVNICINVLKENGIIEETVSESNVLSKHELDRYDRHMLFYSMFDKNGIDIQEKLKNSKIVLLGMGGIGCWTSYALSGAGVGTIVGVDNDTIENSNLTRQILYSEFDIGKYKVDVAKEKLTKYNSNLNFISVKEEIKSSKQLEKIIEGADFVVHSADQPSELHKWVYEACNKQKIAYSNVGYINYLAVCGPMIIPEINSNSYKYKIEEDLSNSNEFVNYIDEINSRYQPPSFGPINGIISCFQAMEVLKYLTGYSEPNTINKRYILDTHTMESSYQEF